MIERICRICGILKSLVDDFYKDGDGYRNDCKKCNSKSRKSSYTKNKTQILENKKSYYQDNKIEIISYQKEYRSDPNNKEIISQNKKQYYIDNKESIKIYVTKYVRSRRQIDPVFRIIC
jgi:hypothetical protein